MNWRIAVALVLLLAACVLLARSWGIEGRVQRRMKDARGGRISDVGPLGVREP